MSDPNKKNDKKDEDEDKGANDYYVGNGQAVMAPPPSNRNNRPGQDTVSSLFSKAHDPKQKPPASSSSKDDDEDEAVPPQEGQAFSGVGRRLGHNADTPSPAVDDGRPVLVTIRVTFYRNGFTVDDGPLLNIQSGEGQEILEAFDKGIVPQSIAGKHPRRAKFDVQLVRKEKEDYVKQFQAFEGTGRSLASSSSGPTTTNDAVVVVPAVAITVSQDAPRGRVLLQLPDGTRRRVETNPSIHTVSELFGEAAVATGVSTNRISLSIREGTGRTIQLEPSDKRTLKDAKADGAAIFVAVSAN
jgi:UBX domain-containing protein 1